MNQHIKTLVAGGVFALALFGVAIAGPREDVLAAFQRGDYAAALHILHWERRPPTPRALLPNSASGLVSPHTEHVLASMTFPLHCESPNSRREQGQS